MFGRETILNKTPEAGGCTNTVDLYNPFPDGGGVALYQLNGDATDESGNYNGTATNVTYGTGQFGQAGVFNGSSSYVLASSFMPTGSNPRSASAWVKTTISNANMTILMSGSGSNNNYFIFRIINGNLGVAFYANDHDFTATGLTDGNWHHVATTYDGSLAKVYLDGNLIGTGSAGAVSTNSSNFAIGAYNTGVDALFNGSIDQVRIFNRALRPYEVEALYTEEYCTPTIVPSEHFNTVTYTGNGSTQSVTGVGFQPDFVWIKPRSFADNHVLSDSVRGINKSLASNTASAENTLGITSFDSNGFSLPSWGNVTSNGNTFVSWNFKAGGAAVTNTDGTITSQVSANAEAGFSIVKFTGSLTSGQTVGHGLTEAPSVVILKDLDSVANWYIYHQGTGTTSGYINYLRFDTTAGDYSDKIFYPINFNTSTFTPGNDETVLQGNVIAYCFAEVEGFSNFGSYVGTGNTVNVVTGFEPAMIIIKRSDSTEDWKIIDNKRGFANSLEPNESIAEEVGNNSNFILSDNGFTIGDPHGDYNANGGKYIYMAFAADPTAVEPSLEDSFNTVTYTGNGGTQNIGGVFEGGASFNGSSSKLRLTSSLATAMGSNDFSISTWVYLDTMPSTFYSIATLQDVWYYYIFIASDGSVRTYNQNVQVNSVAGVVTTGQWYNVVATLSSTSGKNVYLNGVNVASSSDTSNCNAFTNGHTALGYYQSGATVQYTLDGSIDQARIFNTALTAAQVTELYEETDADSHTLDFPSGAGAVALYELNGNANDTGGTYNGTATNVTWLNNGVGFQPDLVWIKNRDYTGGTSHNLFDSIRGNARLVSSSTNAEVDLSPYGKGLLSFDSNGFTVGDETNGDYGLNGQVGGTYGSSYVAWAWKGAEIPAINNNGSITSVVSANPAAGFSISTYSGKTGGGTTGHGLNSEPEFIIFKRYTATQNWFVFAKINNVWHSFEGLNTTAAAINYSAYFSANDSIINWYNANEYNSDPASSYLAYSFHSVAGFSKFGSYSANASGVSVTTDFEPAFVMVKSTTSSHSWYMIDNKRGSTSPNSVSLFPNLSNAEASGYGIYFNSTGFTVAAGVGNGTNGGGNSYIYMAFANQF